MFDTRRMYLTTFRPWLIVTLLATVPAGLAILPTRCAGSSHEDSRPPLSSVFGDPNEFRQDLAEMLRTTVNSVKLSAKIVPPFGTNSESSERILTVSVSFPFKRRSGGIIGVDLSHPVILEATDVYGSRVALLPTELDWHRYEAFGYTVDRSTPSSIRIPPGTLVHLCLDPRQNVPSSLSSVKWYLHALCTENVVEVDIPFEASDKWIEAETIPDLEVRVDRVESHNLVDSAGLDRTLHKYTMTVRSRSGSVVRGQDEELRFGDAVPGYVVLGTKLCNSEGGCLIPSMQHVRGDPFGHGAYCFGKGEWPGKRANRIRCTIAVHPVEAKLPFELTGIPVPSFQVADK